MAGEYAFASDRGAFDAAEERVVARHYRSASNFCTMRSTCVVLRIADDRRAQFTAAVEEQLRRPRVDAVGVPDRERVVDRDRPRDALRAQIRDHVRAVRSRTAFPGCARRRSRDRRPLRVERAQVRHDVLAVVAVEREDVDDHDLAGGIGRRDAAVEPALRGGVDRRQRRRRAALPAHGRPPVARPAAAARVARTWNGA